MQLSLISEDDTAACVACAGNVSQSLFGNDVHNPLEELLGPGCYSRRIVMDCSATELIESSGIGWLIDCHKRCLANGGKLILHTIPPMVDQVLRMMQMHKLLTMKPDRAAALAAAAAARGTA